MEQAGQAEGRRAWEQEQPTLQGCNLSCKPGEKETHLGSDLYVHWKGKKKDLVSGEKMKILVALARL